MKVYTAFLFDGFPDPNELHCTHKYFGEVSESRLQAIKILLKDYFSSARVAPKAVFDKDEMFGEHRNIPVLVTKTPKEDFFPGLRNLLNAFREDDFEYRPHVTTNKEKVDSDIIGYALIIDGKVTDFWPLRKTPVQNAKNGIELRPIKETTEDYDEIELRIITLFKKELYLPLLKEFSESATILRNEINPLITAILSGRITFHRGTFSGRFSSQISKELKKLGARWNRKEQVWKAALTELPLETQNAIRASESNYQRKIETIDKKLSEILPEELAEKLSIEKMFDSTIWKVEREFRKSVRGITVAPNLTKEESKRIADEWQNNMRLWIKDFTEKEIKNLREEMQQTIMAGNRYGSAIEKIKKSFGVTRNKAKFLARQETSLLMTKFKQTRYEAAGVNEYRWGCVAGSPKHPVRPWHKALEGKVFRWDDPPVTTKPGEPARKNNPGQDYNCRCFAKPIVRFR